MSEKLQEALVKVLTEDKKFTLKDVSTEYRSIDNIYIQNYRVGKTGIRFEVHYNIIDGDDNFWLECLIDLKNNGEVSSKIYPRTTEYTIENIDVDSFVNNAIENAVNQGYIELQDGIYVDKRNREQDAAKADFLNMINLSNEELKNILPGRSVKGSNSRAYWTVLGLFTSYDNKEYVAMKKIGSFPDPNIVELERFKKSYKLLNE